MDRRLRSVLTALAGPAAGETAAQRAVVDSAPPSPPAPICLSAAQVRSFVIDGYLVVRPEELGEGFHEELYERSCTLKGWHVGGDSDSTDAEPPPPSVTAGAWEGLPEISDLVQSPTVKGALSSLLGDDCVMHPHRALHTSNSFGDQGFVSHAHLPASPTSSVYCLPICLLADQTSGGCGGRRSTRTGTIFPFVTTGLSG
jgi:hypothetical protein